MPAQTVRKAHDLLDVLVHAEDPLALAAAMAAGEADPAERYALIESAAAIARKAPAARTLQTLERYARSAARSPGAAAHAERLLALPTRPAQWTAAILLEALGHHDRAAEALTGMSDGAGSDEQAVRLIALARNLIRAGRIGDAWRPLQEAARAAGRQATLAQTAALIGEAERLAVPPARATRRVAILGTGTLRFWADALKPALFGAGIHAEIFAGEYGQYHQEIRDPESPLAAFRPDLIILAVDHRALGLPDVSSEPDRDVARVVDQLELLWSVARERFGAALIQCNVAVPAVDPFGRLSAAAAGGRARVLHRINLALWEAAERAHIAVFDMNEAAGVFGKARWHNESLWIAAKQYPAADALPFLARRLAALIRAACGFTTKCVVVDLDNTLWGGVIGEDGLEGIRLGGDPEGEAFVAVQRYLQGLRNRGIALAVCSKNNEADARSVFQRHPETILHESDFADFRANWAPKPDNIRLIAATLNIGLDSVLVLDDSPVERSFIRRELPEVEVPELPDDPAGFPETLENSGLLEALTFTAEDRQRADSYQGNARRAELATRTADLGSYLHELQMHVELRRFDVANLPRIVQLINKTNQFNLTTRRATEADVRRWIDDPACYTQSMRVRDCFGDNGLTGVLVAEPEGRALAIHTWLMSCRVLGRRLENAMLAALMSFARDHGFRALRGEYRETAKNEQVRTLYDRLGFSRTAESPGVVLYERSLDDAPNPPVEWFHFDEDGPHERH